MELYRVYRPSKFKDMIGQDEAVGVLNSYLKNDNTPHCLMFTGPSGCGKTCLARIMSTKLGCGKNDYKEIDAGGKGGIDVIRDLKYKIGATAWGRCKVTVIDEAHELTGAAQEGLLKTAEECPKHAYLFLCTTDPKDLKHTIKTRFTEIKVNGIEPDDMCNLLAKVAAKELPSSKLPPDEVLERIAEVSDGSARMALNVLGKVLRLDSVEQMLDTIQKSESKRTAWDLCTMLLGWGQRGKKTTWKDVKTILEQIKGQEEPEKVRRLILSCLTTAVLQGGKQAERAAVMFEAFRDDYYTVGFAGLAFSCYACTTGN